MPSDTLDQYEAARLEEVGKTERVLSRAGTMSVYLRAALPFMPADHAGLRQDMERALEDYRTADEEMWAARCRRFGVVCPAEKGESHG